MRDLWGQRVDRRGEKVVERQCGEDGCDERRPEATEPRGNQDRHEQHNGRVEDGLQPGCEQPAHGNRKKSARVSGERQSCRVAEYLLSDVALHLEPPSILTITSFRVTSEYSEFRKGLR